jgi:hypothetical protein
MLSSRLTFLYKFVLPVLWNVMFGLGVFAILAGVLQSKSGAPPPPVAKAFLVIVWAFGAAMWFLTVIPIKQVWLVGDGLRISSFRREISMPLADCVEVRSHRWSNPELVSVTFRRETAFGRGVRFMPPLRYWPWGEHPVAIELRERVDTARQAAGLAAGARR